MDFKNKKILVLGKGITGQATASFLIKKEAIVSIKDEKEDGSFIEIDPTEYHLIVQSPGISRQHPFLLKCDQLGIKVTNEIELAAQNTNKKIIAVTGTNGKTTTVNLIHHLLNTCNLKNALVGNVGTPFIAMTENNYDYYVLELSSYQLEAVDLFKPEIAIITNLTPDHLERHKTMDNYLNIKKKIFKNMDSSNFIILNYDDPYLKNIEVEKSKKLFISTKTKVTGIFLENDIIYLNLDKKQLLLNINDLLIFGIHNIENIMFAILAGYLSGQSLECLIQGALTFKGVEHRLEFIREHNGVKYYNDSKSTNPEASITAIKAFNNTMIYLILGGSHKSVDYGALAKTIKENNVCPILQGATREEIKNALELAGVKKYILCKDMKSALDSAVQIAKKDEVIILSPACASFDQFINFENRGEVFKSYVNEIK